VSDLLDAEPDQPDQSTERVCQHEGCSEPLPTEGQGWHFRRYCDAHQPPRKAKGKRRPARAGRDTAPPSIAINLGAKTNAKDPMAAVEKRALALAHTVAAGLLLIGQAEDSGDIARGSAAWAQSVRELAKHEPWIAKALAGGEMGDRALAWVGFTLATGGMVLPIALRHGALPAQIASLVEQVLQTGATLAESDNGEPVAA
jgi:hypothetical protein